MLMYVVSLLLYLFCLFCFYCSYFVFLISCSSLLFSLKSKVDRKNTIFICLSLFTYNTAFLYHRVKKDWKILADLLLTKEAHIVSPQTVKVFRPALLLKEVVLLLAAHSHLQISLPLAVICVASSF